VIATVCKARLRLRWPIRLSRCRVRWPLLASSVRFACEKGECCFVANASAMGPADEELGGHDRSDTGSGQQRGPGRVLRDEDQQLDIQLSGLVDQEPDTSGDRAKRSDRVLMLNGGSGWAGEQVDPVLLGQPEPSQLARRCSGATTIKLFSSWIALVRLIKMPCRVTNTCRSASRSPRSRGVAYSVLGERGARGLGSQRRPQPPRLGR
jgi:hypothetical protein